MSFLDESLSDNACISEPLFQKNAASFWRTVFFLEAFVLFFIVTIAILSGRFDVWKLISFVGIVGLVLLPIFLLIAYSHIGYLRKKLGNVNFDGESISVYDQMHRDTYTAKLADCRWFVGKQTWATIPEQVGTGTGEALLIVFPDSIKKVPNKPRSSPFEEPVIVAVGLMPDTRQQWEQAVERLNVEQEVDRQLLVPPVSSDFIFVWSFFILPAATFTMFWLSKTVSIVLTQWAIPRDVVSGVSFPFFVPGIIYLMYVLSALPHLGRGKKHDPISGWRLFCPFVCICLLFCVFYFTMFDGKGWTLNSAIAATFVNLALTMVTLFFYATAFGKREM